MRTPRGITSAALLVLTAMLSASAARADLKPLTLYQKTGRSPLVVWGEVTDGEHRFAAIRTLDVIKCTIPEKPGDTFRIAFRLDSFLRRPWEDKITFATGDRVLLYLRKFTMEDGEQPDGDLYTLMWGAQGSDTLPSEGAEATVAAARAFVEIQSTDDFDRQAVMLRQAILDPNPILVQGAFGELIVQGLGTLQMLPELGGFLDNPRDEFRVMALRMMAQIISDAGTAGREVPGRRELTDLIRGRAALDPSAPFRVAAIRTLTTLGGSDVRAFIERLAREDPSQDVRYEAQRALLGRKD